jgi:hypothetical protein
MNNRSASNSIFLSALKYSRFPFSHQVGLIYKENNFSLNCLLCQFLIKEERMNQWRLLQLQFYILFSFPFFSFFLSSFPYCWTGLYMNLLDKLCRLQKSEQPAENLEYENPAPNACYNGILGLTIAMC